ncbi:phosphopantothenoylcysteine decarboxylase/phosphopantothenate/cysteine ligase [Desulfonatronospira thiodismutans ASO3-1]|uniref:Coenzyme A biosynthesis bifunctional protein CoaBC n=2 Tax=Desulfonatronospira TaxID=488937 RepID=D6SP88_9BACT|nr:bifunctional phosphopantothenoylcysteine decarboxylase/phosphopantothenate--cysteine ligase CoaBC [Desulfonatronospira thiodismutans]EFI34564.1 phosphopantothenoylcysteine decarboxylase/phosphopantothenate/cysteine ligase [Desulfonatronospira thiodismutans ASO3-1]
MIFDQYQGQRVHLGITGSVAAYRTLDLVRLLQKSSLSVSATITSSGCAFIGPLTLSALGADPVYTPDYSPVEQPFAHLSSQFSPHVFMVAPATANILAKASSGIADDLLSTQILSYPGRVLFAPAMNPNMWNNAATRHNIRQLRDFGHEIIEPDSGKVACGEQGQGRFPDIASLYYICLRELTSKDMVSTKVLITAGPTHEYFDLVRYWSNPSSGRMGLAIALALWLRGAEIHFVHGPMQPLLPLPGFHIYPVTTARDMYDKCSALWPDCTLGVFSAAVADFAPEKATDLKFKKQGRSALQVKMNPTLDILAEMSASRARDQKIVGFAAEAENLEANASAKLSTKSLDMIVANQVTSDCTPFGSDENQVLIMDKTGRMEYLPKLSKQKIAWRMADWILEL